nr:MAG TPA: prohead serine protease [Caudoviricetes sp.]
MQVEVRNDSVLLDGYVNAVARDSKPTLDENGEKFIEQITPKAFERAIGRNEDILCLLNHEPNRKLGSTKDGNIKLFEDNIGLRAICEITDSEVIEKAKEQRLRGWSFGFEAIKEYEETISDNLKRRFIDEMNLLEVSIIDDKKVPCYVGTSIETRAEKLIKTEFRGREAPSVFITNQSLNTPQEIDYSVYENILKQVQNKRI